MPSQMTNSAKTCHIHREMRIAVVRSMFRLSLLAMLSTDFAYDLDLLAANSQMEDLGLQGRIVLAKFNWKTWLWLSSVQN